MTETPKASPSLPPEAPAADEPTDEHIAHFLRHNPDFLIRRADLLTAMTPPKRWTGDGVIDMQKYMLDHLRGEMETLRSNAQSVVETSRHNLSSQGRIHAAVLEVLRAGDLDTLARTVGEELPIILDVDAVTLGFEPPTTPLPALISPHIGTLPPGTVDTLLGTQSTVVLLDATRDDGTVFGAASGLVRSAALARINSGETVPPGLLALGTRRPAFHHGQGTELIGFLARVVERCVHGWLETPD